MLRDPDFSPKYGATGNGIAIMSNRISFFLDINGPSMTIDTGCSASLVCVHNACQSLRDGEVDIVSSRSTYIVPLASSCADDQVRASPAVQV